MTAFGDAVQLAGRTLLVLDMNGTALTRVWCVYELWKTVLSGGSAKLTVLHPTVEFGALRNLFHSVAVERSQASFPEDAERILGDIERSIGFVKLNKEVRR